MGVPEGTLEGWSHQQGTTEAKRTYRSVQTAFERQQARYYDDKKPNIYLQGSYANDTNVHGNSDVDIIVEHANPPFEEELQDLSPEELDRYNDEYSTISYSTIQFRNEVLRTLANHYGPMNTYEVRNGKKAIEITNTEDGRRDADVIPCVQHRWYTQFPESGKSPNNYIAGICFSARNGTDYRNYPKKHRANGTKKNYQCDGNYKPTVRMFKNATKKLVERGYLHEETAPSYFLVCLLYNVPPSKFQGSFRDRYQNILDYLSGADWEQFLCQNEQRLLFGDKPQQWNVSDALEVVDRLQELWEEW